MVTLVFTVLGLAGWGLARQMDHLAEDLPRYRVCRWGKGLTRVREQALC
jgi:hypothetical protein